MATEAILGVAHGENARYNMGVEVAGRVCFPPKRPVTCMRRGDLNNRSHDRWLAPWGEGVNIRNENDDLRRLADNVNALGYPQTIVDQGWIYGVWYCGTAYQKAIYYGQYPQTFVKRIRAMFPDERMLHLCCGRCHIDGAINVDMKPLPEADLVGNVEGPLPLTPETFDVVLIDPPYSEEDATRYGVPRLVKASLVMKESSRLLVDGGWLLWLDEKYPTFKKREWALRGVIAVISGAGRRTRLLSMFQKPGTVWAPSMGDHNGQLRLQS